MALIFIGKSACSLCGEVITSNEDVFGLPPSSKTDNPLHPFFDAAFHKTCFENWDKKNDVLKIIEDEKEEFRNSDYYKQMEAKHGKPNW